MESVDILRVPICGQTFPMMLPSLASVWKLPEGVDLTDHMKSIVAVDSSSSGCFSELVVTLSRPVSVSFFSRLHVRLQRMISVEGPHGALGFQLALRSHCNQQEGTSYFHHPTLAGYPQLPGGGHPTTCGSRDSAGHVAAVAQTQRDQRAVAAAHRDTL
eukprot:gene32463-42055_t